MLSPNKILRSRYRIIQLLGHGGMGAVYQAIDENLNRLVAVKEAFGSSEELRRAFRREAELLGNLRHRALPKSIEHFSENSSDYFVMEFIPGNDLAELSKLRASPFPESDVLGWADEVLAVLAYLHGQGLIHRDIKPSNIKLTKEGELFLLDFGLAKGAVGQMGTLVTSRSVRGYTPAYASLEQILGQGTDARSDIYSVGATFYHLLAGVAPVDASTRFQKMDDEGKDPLPLIQHENPLASPHVAGIIHSAMAINRKRRPESAEQMREALRSNQAERPRKMPSAPAQPGPTPPSPTQPSPTQPAPSNSLPSAEPIVATMPVSSPPKSASAHTNRIFAVEDVPLEEPKRNRGSFLKPLLIGIGVILLLTGASMTAVILKTGWAPWSDKNLYDDTKTEGTLTSQNANTSALADTSPSPDKPTTETPSAGSVVRNQIGMELVWIPPGSFMMGSNDGRPDEKPVHQVTIGRGFYMSKYELTWAEWLSVTGNSTPGPNYKGNENKPIYWLTWHEAQEVISRLNSLDDGYLYRMPTEAEWEYACRAGTTSEYYARNLDDIAWYSKNSGSSFHRVGGKQPNAFGLYDMVGNTQEWCEDWHRPNYQGAPTDGRAWIAGDERGLRRVLRGGSMNSDATRLRCAYRSWGSQNYNLETGVRLVAVAVQAAR
ncbi:MAG: protein kinase domain-containing protein [Acidobacteriota bacterium]